MKSFDSKMRFGVKSVEGKKLIRNMKPLDKNINLRPLTFSKKEDQTSQNIVDSEFKYKFSNDYDPKDSLIKPFSSKTIINKNLNMNDRNKSSLKILSTLASTEMRNSLKTPGKVESLIGINKIFSIKSRNIKSEMKNVSDLKMLSKNEKSLEKVYHRKIFQEFETKFGDPNLKSFVTNSSLNFIKKLKSKDQADIDNNILSTRNHRKENRVKRMKVKAATQMELNKYLINNHKLGEINNCLENSK